MSEKVSAALSSPLGRLIRGLLKIMLAGLVYTILSSANIPTTWQIGGESYDVGTIIQLITYAGPLLLIVSGLHDMGVKL